MKTDTHTKARSNVRTVMASQAGSTDLQMQLPHRPKLVSGVQPLWYSRECLVLIGAGQTVTLRGSAVSTILPTLLPLLDGSRTLEDVGRLLPRIDARVLEKALLLLFMRGLLAGEAAPCEDPLQAAVEREPQWQPVLDAYERCLDITRVSRSAAAVLAKMRRAKILVISDSPHAVGILRALKEFGLGAATLVTPDEDVKRLALELVDESWQLDVRDPAAETTVLSHFREYTVSAVVSAQPAIEKAMALEDVLLGQPLLYAVLGETELRIGPSTNAPATTCMRCALASGVFDPVADVRYGELELEIGAERVAHKLLQLVTRLVPIDSFERSEILDADTLLFKAQPVLRQFGCPRCTPLSHEWNRGDGLDLGGAHLAPLPWFYHRSSQHVEHLMAPKGHQAHYASRHKQSSAGAYKHYRSRARLPSAELTARSEAFERLSRMLHLAVGRRSLQVSPDVSIALRMTPSGGSMASQNIYVLSYESATRGVYYFDPGGHWQPLSSTVPTLAELGVPAARGIAPAYVLMLTCAHARLESKYGNVAYRYGFYDAGVLLSSLQALAPAHEFECHTSAHFDDEAAAELFGALQTNEFATAIAALTSTVATHAADTEQEAMTS